MPFAVADLASPPCAKGGKPFAVADLASPPCAKGGKPLAWYGAPVLLLLSFDIFILLFDSSWMTVGWPRAVGPACSACAKGGKPLAWYGVLELLLLSLLSLLLVFILLFCVFWMTVGKQVSLMYSYSYELIRVPKDFYRGIRTSVIIRWISHFKNGASQQRNWYKGKFATMTMNTHKSCHKYFQGGRDSITEEQRKHGRQ